MIGKTYKVLVTGYDRRKGFLSGKTEGKIIVRFPYENDSLIGTFILVRITSYSNVSVAGEISSELKDQKIQEELNQLIIQ